MPRYFLHIHDHHGLLPDEEGQVLPGIDAARAAALVGIRSMLKEELFLGELDLRGRIDIAGEDGESILSVPFEDAVTIRRDYKR